MRFATLILGAFATIAAAAPVPAEQTEATSEHGNPILPLPIFPILPLGGAIGAGLGAAAANAAAIGAGALGAGVGALARGGRDLADRIGDRLDDFWGRNDDDDVVYVYGPPPPGYYGPPPGYYGKN